mmetsp:Transcript_8856/g.13148  ORF Transcript_8856/g.13148 Transcript_8856/m.13148 type:complete len:333 (-) Transcript_8856:11-1009(-)
MVPDNIFPMIFKYISFKDLFNSIALVCKWWRHLLYGAFETLDFININNNIYFSHIPLNITSIPALENLITKFYAIRTLKLERFENANDECVSSILDNCPCVESIFIRSAGISDISIRLSNLKSLSIVSCPRLMNFTITSSANTLKRLKISQCDSIDGDALSKVVKPLKNVEEFDFSGNEKISDLDIQSNSLLQLNLSFCSNFYSLAAIRCPNIVYLNISYTSVYDRSITTLLSNCVNLQQFHCIGILSLFVFTVPPDCNNIQSLHLSGNANLKNIIIETDENQQGKVRLPKLSHVDLRICESLNEDCIKDIIEASDKNVLKSLLYNEKNEVL